MRCIRPILVALVLAAAVTAGISHNVVGAAPHAPTYNEDCETSNCYGIVRWNGGAYGAQTTLAPPTMGCPPSACPQVQNANFVNIELWLVDVGVPRPNGIGGGDAWALQNCENFGSCWVGVGTVMTGFDPDPVHCSTTYCYYWEDARPCGGGYHIHYGANVNGDIGFFEQATVEHVTTDQYYGTCDVNDAGVPNTQWYSTIASHIHGTGASGYSTYNPMHVNEIDIGGELKGTSGQYSGTFYMKDNTWENSGTTFTYQNWDGYTDLDENPPWGDFWQTPPHTLPTTGGEWIGSCGCS